MYINKLSISEDDVQNAFDNFVKGSHYEENEYLLKDIIGDECYKNNSDYRIVALKLGLIDTLYSTNLNKDMATTSVTTIAQIIADPKYKFDERIYNGDISLAQDIVNDLRFKRNNFSLISKYCKIHEYFQSNTDCFVIYDSVVAENLYCYLPYYKSIKITSHTPKNMCMDKRNYILWCDFINQVIHDNNLNEICKIRRKLDWFIWGVHNTKLD